MLTKREKINVLMVGEDSGRIGGMWSVADSYINSQQYNDNINLIYIPTSTGGNIFKRLYKMLTGYCRILNCFFKNKIDIVHIHMAEKGSVYRKGVVLKIANLFGVKTVVQMHAGPIMDWYHGLSNQKKKTVKRIFNRCDRMLVLGEYWKNQLLEIVSDSKIDVLYNGTNCSEENMYNVNGKYVLFLGMITKRKGAYDLIEAINKIDNLLDEDIQFLFCGYDEDSKAENYTISLSLQNRIIFLGWVNKEEKEKYFRNSRLCVLPSYFEGLSMTVIESIAHGIPVVTSNISTMPEILGDSIHLVEPGDVEDLAKTLLNILSDANMRQYQSNYVFERAKNIFSIEKNIDNTINIYQRCLER